MKRLAFVLCLAALCMGLGGCSLSQQPEHQAYVISLGLDRATDGQLEVFAQVPSIGGGQSGEEGASGSEYQLFSAKGHSVATALDLLKATLPSRMQLALTKSIVVSEKLAREDSFPAIIDELTLSYSLYDSTALIVTRGETKEFLEAQKPAIGIRLSTSVMASLELYHQNGYIPSATLYDLFCANHSIYSDPALILADTGPGGQSEGGSGGQDGGSQGGSGEQTGSSEPNGSAGSGQSGGSGGQQQDQPQGTGPMSGDGLSFPGELPRTGPNKNQYMGCALMRDGRMVGMLDGVGSRWLSILRGAVGSISYTVDGQALELRTKNRPRVNLDLLPDGIRVQVELSITSAQLVEHPPLDLVRQQVTKHVQGLFEQCQQAGVEPFGLAEQAALGFATAQDFADYQFREKFCRAPVTVSVQVENAKL